MFAIVRTGGKQYRVAAGDKIVVDKIEGDAGARVSLGDVLLAGDGSDLKSGVAVAAEIVAQAKGEKVIVFKKRRRHNYRRKNGHRQQHTILRILSVGDEKAPAKKAAQAKPVEAPVEAAPAPVEQKTPAIETRPAKAAAKSSKPKAAPVEAKPAKTKPKAKATAAAKAEAKPKASAKPKAADTDTTAVKAEPVKKAATKKAPAAKAPKAPKE